MPAQKIIHLPTSTEVELAKNSSRTLAKYLASNKVKLTLQAENNQAEELQLPSSIMQLLVDVLAEVSQGNAISLVPHHKEITTQEAANLLNVSRPFFVSLLEKNELPYRKVGSHRRVLLKDVLAYRETTQQLRNEALDELATLSQAEGMGY